MLLSTLTLSVFAITETSENIFAGGDGTAENPYKVSTPEQLDAIRNNLSANYIQINDIDLSNWGNWQPIGKYGGVSLPDQNMLFSGSFNGNNYTISNMTIIDTSVNPEHDSYGLFSAISNCKIVNVNLENIHISVDKTSTNYVTLWETKGSSFPVRIGGICGAVYKDSKITNCRVTGKITLENCSDCYVAGIVGDVTGLYANSIDVSESVSCTDISVVANRNSRFELDSCVQCGGIVGGAGGRSEIISCENSGNISAIGGSFVYVGGISGRCGEIYRCNNKGNVSGITLDAGHSSFAGGCNAGGIVGTSHDYTELCINSGNVKSEAQSENFGVYSSVSSFAGGICGYNGYYGSGTLSKNINVGNSVISYAETKDSNNTLVKDACGRIAGYSSSTSMCYSVDHTTVNSSIPNSNISPSQINGGTLTIEEIIDLLMTWEVPEHNEGLIPVETELKYGSDRLNFGKDISGYIGDEIDSLVVYTSANENIASLDITSSNTNVVEIGTIEIGVGDYITTSENEHIATIPLKLKAEGMSTITITSPEGVSTSIIVTVTDSATDFNMPIYIANRWLDKNGVHYPAINDFMYNCEAPSLTTVNLLNSDKGFKASVAAWETANIINDPSKIADNMIEKEKYYESIILSLLSAQFEGGTLSGTITQIKETGAAKYYKFAKTFTKYLGSIEGMDENYILTQPLTKSEKDLIKNDLKANVSSQVLDSFKSVDILIDILDYADDINDFYEICGKYLTLQEIDEAIVHMLTTMYKQSNDLYFKDALSQVIISCNNQFGAMLVGIQKGTIQILQWTADEMSKQLWKAISESNVYAACLKAGLSVGISIDNIVFSTDKTIAKYYAMECLCNVRELINQSSLVLAQEYMNNQTEETAKAYITSVDFIYNSFVLSCNYAVDFQKIVREDSLAGKILFKNDNSFNSFKKTAESLVDTVEFNYDWLKRSWCYDLLDDYPDLFDVMAKEIDLKWYTHLEDASIRVNGINFNYTGKPIEPSVTVTLNGKELKEGEDYTLSYQNNIEAGIAKVIVNGCGLYNGSIEGMFTINEKRFNKRVDIRNNGAIGSDFELFSLKSRSLVATYSKSSASNISVSVSKEGNDVVLIENGIILFSNLQVIVDNNYISILLPDEGYEVNVTSNQSACIDYSYTEYDEDYNLIKEAVYNKQIIYPNSNLSQSINYSDDTVYIGNLQIEPVFDSTNDSTKHSINIENGVASSESASENEWVYISAVVPDGYTFVEWQTSNNIDLLDEKSANTSFIMSDSNVELVAICERMVSVNISGDITSYGNTTDLTTVKLLQDTTEIYVEQTSSGSYSFENVVSGEYTLQVSKANHVTRTYEIIVGNEDITQDVKIHLLGDVTGDGQVKIGDYAKILAHVKGTSIMTGYELNCADVTGDGFVKIGDYAKVLAHVKGASLLW